MKIVGGDRVLRPHFTVSRLCDGGAYLLSIAALLSRPPKEGSYQLPIYLPRMVDGLFGRGMPRESKTGCYFESPASQPRRYTALHFTDELYVDHSIITHELDAA